LIFRTKRDANALFHKCTANIFHRKKADEVALHTSNPETHLPLPPDHVSSTRESHANANLDIASINIDFETVGFAASSYSSHSVRKSNLSVDRATRTPKSGNTSVAIPQSKYQIARVEAKQTTLTTAPLKAPAVLPELQVTLTKRNCNEDRIDSFTGEANIVPEALNSTRKMSKSPTLKKKLKTQLMGLFKSPTIHKQQDVGICHEPTDTKSTSRQEDENGHQEAIGIEYDDALADGGEWTQVRAIPEEKYCQLVLQACDPFRKVKPGHIAVVGHCEGAFHRVTFVRLYRDSKFEDYVVRVPAHGASELWTEEDVYMMEREVDLMRYVRLHTKTPIAQLFDHDTDLNNSLGMPYTLQARIEGTPAYKVWFPDGKDYHPESALRDGDHPSRETEKKRVNFLLSLARAMNELGTLHFDQTGSLIVRHTHGQAQTASTGPHYIWTNSTDPGKSNQHMPGSSTQNIIQDPLDDFCNIEAECMQRGALWHRDIEFCRRVGMRKILAMVFSTSAFNQTAENFTIWHPDLDLQNILTDENGNVTGIIDWDGAFIAPRCMGASAVPKFLNRDWFPQEVGGLYSFPNLIWRTDYYRSIYAAAMIREAPMHKHPDGHFISNSAIYTSVLSGVLKLNGGGDVGDFVTKILQSIPRLHRIPEKEYLVELGRGLAEEEELLRHDIAVMVEPQLPESKYFGLLRSFTSTSLSAPPPDGNFGSTSRDSCETLSPDNQAIDADRYNPSLGLAGSDEVIFNLLSKEND
jgi:hypothetical protein